jgi:hypothetical protein
MAEVEVGASAPDADYTQNDDQANQGEENLDDFADWLWQTEQANDPLNDPKHDCEDDESDQQADDDFHKSPHFLVTGSAEATRSVPGGAGAIWTAVATVPPAVEGLRKMMTSTAKMELVAAATES